MKLCKKYILKSTICGSPNLGQVRRGERVGSCKANCADVFLYFKNGDKGLLFLHMIATKRVLDIELFK